MLGYSILSCCVCISSFLSFVSSSMLIHVFRVTIKNYNNHLLMTAGRLSSMFWHKLSCYPPFSRKSLLHVITIANRSGLVIRISNYVNFLCLINTKTRNNTKQNNNFCFSVRRRGIYVDLIF